MADNALAVRLRELREEAVLTVRELSEHSGVSEDTITKIENGHRSARPSTVRKLADALGVEPQELRGAGEPVVPKAPSGPESLDQLRGFLEARLGSAWITLPEDEWRNWWRGVNREEATKRFRQILAESKLIWNTWGRAKSREEISAFASSDIFLLRFVRRLEAPFFAPQQDESEEEFQERSKKGLAIPSYYDPIFKEQRQDMVQEAEEEQRQLAA